MKSLRFKQSPSSNLGSSSECLRELVFRSSRTVHLSAANVFGALLILSLVLAGCKSANPTPESPYPQVKIKTVQAMPPDPLSGSNIAKKTGEVLPTDQILTPGLDHIGTATVDWDCDPSPGVVSNLYGTEDGQTWTLLLSTTNCEATFPESLPFQFWTVSSSNAAGEVFCGSTNIIWNKSIASKSP